MAQKHSKTSAFQDVHANVADPWCDREQQSKVKLLNADPAPRKKKDDSEAHTSLSGRLHS